MNMQRLHASAAMPPADPTHRHCKLAAQSTCGRCDCMLGLGAAGALPAGDGLGHRCRCEDLIIGVVAVAANQEDLSRVKQQRSWRCGSACGGSGGDAGGNRNCYATALAPLAPGSWPEGCHSDASAAHAAASPSGLKGVTGCRLSEPIAAIAAAFSKSSRVAPASARSSELTVWPSRSAVGSLQA